MAFTEPPDPGYARTLPELIGQLRLLKAWAGGPSYAQIADRVNRLWAAAGALTAALLASDGGADVVVVEKDRYIGGTTAVSGGDMWIPNNHHIADQLPGGAPRRRRSRGAGQA